MHVRQNWPLRLGIFLALIGVASLVLPMFGYQLRYLMWADGGQPFLGIGLIVVGAALLIVPMVLKRSAQPAPDAPALDANSTYYGPSMTGQPNQQAPNQPGAYPSQPGSQPNQMP